MRLLLVDDDRLDRLAIVRGLASFSPEIVEMTSAVDGVEAAKNERFDCILLDYSLPGHDGLWFLEETAAADVDTPVIILTGQGDEHTAVELMKAGAADYVVKGTIDGASLLLRIERARERTEAARFERQVLAIVSHDLRNPIHTILLSAQMLELKQGATPLSRRIVSAAERAGRMISDLLDFSQARSQGILITREPVDLCALVDEIAADTRLRSPKRELIVEHDGDGRGEWDPDRLTQVLGNLLTNALAYSVDDTPVRVACVDRGSTVELRVHNEGAPIPGDILASIFEPMTRGTHVGRETKSVGLGLYIVRSIVRAHGGVIEVTSSAERGTTFVVGLPRTGPAAAS